MFKHMSRDLEKLRYAIMRMASAVEEAIFRASRALQERNPTLSQQVIDGDAAIDRMENEVQEECLKVLALHQPVAVDLRRVSMMFLICTDLERMGDHAVGIAERAATLSSSSPLPPFVGPISRMSERAIQMVRLSLDAFVKQDPAAAKTVIRMDDEVDRDNAKIIADVIEAMKRNPNLIEAGLSLFSAVRLLERIADHATNIAEDVVYLVEGSQIRHHPEALGG